VTERKNESSNSIGRRYFLKSIFGLGAALKEKSEAQGKTGDDICFLWADLHTGFVGFPTGVRVRDSLGGSVMKLIAAATVLEESLLDPNHKVVCPGQVTVNGETFNCQYAHGPVDLTMAIAVSCNYYFVHAAHLISTPLILQFAKKFGMDAPFSRYPSGKFPSQSKDPSYTFVLGLNESMQPNALQLLRMAALIAMNGQTPYLHSADDLEPGKPFSVSLQQSTWHRLQQGMQMAVKHGTARKLDPENSMLIAAKTGTSKHGLKFQSCIIGFFPYDQPSHAFFVGAQNGTSQESAVPQAHKFLFSTTWP
jgi:cell division protein FtsI/penicillin-binding protein 2